jgi:DNA-binding transcriptional ArsR family regulator
MQEDQNTPDEVRRVREHHQADRVLDAGALRALAHPLRVKIFDILSQYGPQTASSLATRLGESSGATSYHLRALAKQDLIREVSGQGTARERWWERPAGGVTFTNPDEIKTPSGRAAHQLVTGEFFRLRQQQLLDFLDRGLDEEDESWKESSMVSTATTRLTAAQAKELAARILALVDEAVETHRDQTGDDVRPVTIRADLFPLPHFGDPS